MTDIVSPVRPVRRLHGLSAGVAAVVVASVVAVVICVAAAAIARGAGASDDFKALTVPVFSFFVVVGLAAGAIGWALIRRRASDPASLLRWLVPTVLVVSLVPDVLVGATDSLPGTSWGAIAALMLMHVVVTVCGVVSYRLFLPLV